MKWAVQLKDDKLIQSNDLIYSQIKNRIDDLITLTAIVNNKVYRLEWAEKKFIVGDAVFTIHDATNLTDIKPICFKRQLVQFTVHQNISSSGAPTTIAMGLGFQGCDASGKNIKCYILIDKDGTFKVEVV